MIQAAHVAPAPSRCHVVCFLLRCAPSGGVRPRRRRPGCEVSHPKWRSWNPRHRPRSLRSRRGDRRRSARRGPRSAHRLPRAPQPPHEPAAARWRRVGARAAAETAGLGSAPSSPRRGRMAPRCAKPRARPEGSGRRTARGRGHRCAPLLRRSAPLKRLHGRRGYVPARAGFHCAAPTVPACALR